ncbi:MAG: LptF/LptG family permease [Bacteroidales bacterium]|jgi:lipopolysaccharide export system permease protein|nr:LptF/LptG family permease [Bacteroidales bacterium]
MKYNLKITTIDRYIIRKFIGTFFFLLLLIIVVAIIFDISEKIDDFVDKQAPLKAIMFNYYANFIPYFINMFSPLFVFIAVIFFTSKLASNSEIIGMLAGGISFRRLMYPYFLSAAFIAIFSLTLNLFIIPPANKGRLDFENRYIKKQRTAVNLRNMHYQISPGTFLYVESFSGWNNTAYKFTIENINGNDLTSKLSASYAQWDSIKNCWKLKNYFLRKYKNNTETITTGKTLDTTLAITVADFHRRKNISESMNYKELNNLIKIQKARGDHMVKYALIEKNTRFAIPFSAFILTLMGVALSSKKRRGGIGMNLGIGIALSFSYILFLRFSQMFVYTDTLPAWIALWIPNVLYAIVAGFLYRIAPK